MLAPLIASWHSIGGRTKSATKLKIKLQTQLGGTKKANSNTTGDAGSTKPHRWANSTILKQLNVLDIASPYLFASLQVIKVKQFGKFGGKQFRKGTWAVEVVRRQEQVQDLA